MAMTISTTTTPSSQSPDNAPVFHQLDIPEPHIIRPQGLPFNVLDLPKDIWLEILSYFTLYDPLPGGNYPWGRSLDPDGSRLSTLQSARLVCRGLQELVDPLIWHSIHIDLDTPSMERMLHLSRNPSIARSVRGVRVNLSFRSAAIASDLPRYHKMVKDIARQAEQICGCYTADTLEQLQGDSPEAVEFRNWADANRTFRRLQINWLRFMARQAGDGPEDTSDDGVDAHERSRDIRLLQDCFQLYGLKHADQDTIVRDGSFVRNTALAISQLKQPIILDLYDFDRGDPPNADMFAIPKDLDRFAKYMLTAQTWNDIDKLGDESEIPPARILTELPLACNRAGAPLRGLNIKTFPHHRNLCTLLPLSATPASDTWAELAAACRNLEFLAFAGSAGTSHPAYISPESRQIIDNYLTALCSGRRLRSFSLNMYRLAISDLQENSGIPEHKYRAEKILSRLKGSKLTSVIVSSVALTGSALERLIGTLQPSLVRDLIFANIHLESGTYVDAVDLLRDKFMHTIRGGKCELELRTLEGAEFGPPRKFDDQGTHYWEDKYWDLLHAYTHPPLLKRTTAYVSGEHDGPNPLRVTESK